MTVFFEDGSRLKVRKEVEEHYTSCIADLFRKVRDMSGQSKDPFIYMAFIMACLRFSESGLSVLYIGDPERHFDVSRKVLERRRAVREPLSSGNGYIIVDPALEGGCLQCILNMCTQVYEKEGLVRYIAFLCVLKRVSEKSLWCLDERTIMTANALHLSIFL